MQKKTTLFSPGWEKFEFLWEPNFPLNDFALNNGNKSVLKLQKICVIFLSNLRQRCQIFTQFFNIRWNRILQKVPATRIMFLPKKEIVCKSYCATGRLILPFEEITCHRKQCPVKVPNLLSQEKISVTGRNWSREIFFLCDKVNFFSCKRICSSFCNKHSSFVNQQYFSCHKSFISCER